MSDITAYIKHLKEQFNASDELIVEKLVSAGWTAEDAKNAIKLTALPDAPSPAALPIAATHHESHATKTKGGLSSLSQALQHILLWFFSISTTITLSIVSASLFGTSTSSEPLSVYVAVALVTFSPFGFVFWDFVKKYKKDRTIVTGRVWSIITIVLHSIAAIISGIVLISTLIMGQKIAVTIATTTIILLNLTIVATYYYATFGKSTSKLRHILIYSFLPVIVILLVGFGLLSLNRLGPIKADENVRKKLVETAQAIVTYRKENNSKLPATVASIKNVDTKGVTYKKKSETEYSLCAVFKTKRKYVYSSYTDNIIDTNVSDYSFYNNEPGEKCFTLTTSYQPRTYPL